MRKRVLEIMDKGGFVIDLWLELVHSAKSLSAIQLLGFFGW